MKRSFFCVLCIVFSSIAFASNNKKVNNEGVIIQMNYCINSMTNIIHNKSISVLDHESDQLVNNLTMEQIVGIPEIKEFRVELMDAVAKFQITEEERSLMRRINSLQRDNMKWKAISNALDPTMLITGGGSLGPQLAFQALIAAARTAVEYKSAKNEQNIEEMKAMWDLRKEELNEINTLRKEAFVIIFNLYEKYNFKESDRLTESSANFFAECIMEPDAAKRIRILESNKSVFFNMPDYYYFLGMAYLDNNMYLKAKPNFEKYRELYKKMPLFRYDEKSGCIALTMLANERNLTKAETVRLIDEAINNLPGNSAAVLQCSMMCIYSLRDVEKGFSILLKGIDDPRATDRELLYMATANLMPILVSCPQYYPTILSIFEKSNGVSLDSYLTYSVNSRKNVWSKLNKVMKFSNCGKKISGLFGFSKSFNSKFSMTIPGRIAYNYKNISVYLENHSKGELKIVQLFPMDKYAVTKEDVEDIDIFKEKKDLKYLYFERIDDNHYVTKLNLDIASIRDETFPKQPNDLDEDAVKDIADFCENHRRKNTCTILKFSEYDGVFRKVKTKMSYDVKFKGEKLKYRVHHSDKQNGIYIRFVLINGIQILYKYESESKTLKPFMFSDKRHRCFANYNCQTEYSLNVPAKNKTVEQKPDVKKKNVAKKTLIHKPDAKKTAVSKKMTVEQKPIAKKKNVAKTQNDAKKTAVEKQSREKESFLDRTKKKASNIFGNAKNRVDSARVNTKRKAKDLYEGVRNSADSIKIKTMNTIDEIKE